MPKCPKCGKEIRALNYKVIDSGVVRIRENGEIEYELISDYGLEQKEVCDFSCPECDAILFDNEDDALDFLMSDGEQT